ncbi:cytochrome c oxidase assembly factor Coa1 family protein [Psychroserpens luteus]|uniref:Cytochrome c oxidase assembly factor Coa1 family protein n=1 Tax=Psychroserpens luteus TaxID=1434066 RepID=A0ABW5ZY77_9FLAO|nr:cytochrome c oxidase assembly factor Coa1 family protein [Psychroserpens luteus]
MDNIIIQNKNWWQRNWKWLIPSTVIMFGLLMFLFSGLGGAATDISKAYAEKDLYNNAFEKVKANDKASKVLGELQPIDNLAILEGSVNYSNDNKTIKSSIRIVGSKARGKLDIIADKVDDVWGYKLINVRVKQPKDQKQTIAILSLD